MSDDWQGMNKQCRQCHQPFPDGSYVEHGSYVVCHSCNKTLPKADIVYSMLAVSYRDETIKAVSGIVGQLEQAIVAKSREANYWRDEVARLREEMRKQKRKIIGNV